MIDRDFMFKVIKEQTYSLAFENAPDKFDEQAIEGAATLVLAKYNKDLKSHNLNIKVREKKNSKSMFLYVNDKTEIEISEDDRQEFEDQILDDISKVASKNGFSASKNDIEALLVKNENDAYEYMVGAQYLLEYIKNNKLE